MSALALLALLAASPGDVRALDWLSGCWSSEKNGRVITEVWLRPSLNVMLGLSQTVKDGRTTEFESMRIEQRHDGSVAFVANPSGQPGASFARVESAKQRVVFFNDAHDFPQRITYERSGETLTATIEGPFGGTRKKISFDYRRTKCQ